ncbi:MAG: hypothetical protein RL186_145 [Pseudomonadota bacterium]
MHPNNGIDCHFGGMSLPIAVRIGLLARPNGLRLLLRGVVARMVPIWFSRFFWPIREPCGNAKLLSEFEFIQGVYCARHSG